MSQSRRRTIRFAVAVFCVVALLIVVGRLALREPPVSPNERPSAVVATPPPVYHIASPLNGAGREADSNRVIEATSTNAAAIYRQAFVLYEALSNGEKEVIGNWRTNVDPLVDAELCEKIQPICKLMHQAATLTNCDWGIEEPIVSSTRLPHLMPGRNIARAMVWSAVHCRTDDTAGAIDDLVASSKLGSSLSSPPIILTHLFDLAIQNLVMEAVAEHASMFTGADDRHLVQLFDDAWYVEELCRAIEGEAYIVSHEADKLAAMPPEEVAHELEELKRMGSSEVQTVDTGQAIAGIRQAAELERELAEALDSSEADYRDWLARSEAVRSTNPFVEMFLPVIGTEVDRTQATTVRSAMVVAGLAVIRDGPNALLSHTDPITGQQFTYTETAGGFELQSGYQVNGQPLKLSFR